MQDGFIMLNQTVRVRRIFILCFVMLRFQAHIQLQRFAKNLVLIKRLSGANASRSNSQGLDVQLSVFSRSRKKKKKRKEVEMETEGETLGGRAND